MRSPVGSLVTVLLLWSAAFPAITYALRTIPATDLVVLRLWVAAAILAVAIRRFRVGLPKTPLDALRFFIAGGVGWLGYNLLLFLGQRTVTPGSAAFITNLAPVFATALAWGFLKERPQRAATVSLTTGLAGVTLIALGEGKGFHFDAGVLWVLAASFCSSSANVMLKPLVGRYRPVEVIVYLILSAWLLSIPWWAGVPTRLVNASVGALAAAIFLGAVLALTGALWARILASMTVASATASTYLIPVLAVLISAVWLSLWPTPLALAGGAMVIGGQAYGYWIGRNGR